MTSLWIEFVDLCDVVQSVDIVKYTDEEYEKYLIDPVRIHLRLHLFIFFSTPRKLSIIKNHKCTKDTYKNNYADVEDLRLKS